MPADPISLSTDDLVRERYKEDSARPFKLRAYYALKPLLPRKSQIALRRAYAAKQARREFPRWPIEPILVERRKDELLAAARSAGAAHAYLADWPDGRHFAAILTHDVEGP